MNTHMKILVDVDDTIGDLLSAWLDFLNNKYGTNIHNDEITEWDITKFFPSLTREQIYEPLHTDEFWKTVKPKPGAAKYMKLLLDAGFEIYLCTSTDYRNIRAKFEFFIKKYFPFIKWDDVIVTHKKQMIKADYLIDDGVHNLEGGEFTKLLVSSPHNRAYNAEANGMIRVNNWHEIYRLLKQP